MICDGARVTKRISGTGTETITLMLSNEFLFFLLLLSLLIDELLIDVNVLIGNLLRDGFNF